MVSSLKNDDTEGKCLLKIFKYIQKVQLESNS